MRRLALLVLLALAPSPALAEWGEKAPACPGWASRISELEQRGESARLRELRNRYDGQCVALNEIQVLAMHNAYHIEPRPELMSLLLLFDPGLTSLQYSHPALAEQFSELGIRQIELDV